MGFCNGKWGRIPGKERNTILNFLERPPIDWKTHSDIDCKTHSGILKYLDKRAVNTHCEPLYLHKQVPSRLLRLQCIVSFYNAFYGSSPQT